MLDHSQEEKIIVELDNYLDRLTQVKEKQRNAASFVCAKLNFGLNLLICGVKKSSSKLEKNIYCIIFHNRVLKLK